MNHENPYMKGQTWPNLNILETLRQRNPLVICITNDVVRTFTANGLLAIGASPVMSECSEDLKDLIVHASALLINIGTLTPDKAAYYKEAIALAKKHEVPIVLDPVGCHAGAYRLSVVLDLIKTGNISLLRGNQSEIKAIYDTLSLNDTANNSTAGKGVDGAQVEDSAVIAYRLTRLINCPVVATGEEDYVSDGTRVFAVPHGHPIMTSVTGTGCLLGAVLAAFFSAYYPCKDRVSIGEFLAYVLAYYGLAGESAVQVSGVKPGSFSVAFMDALYMLDDAVLISENHIRPIVVPDQLQVYFIGGTQDVGLNENRLLSVVEEACRGGVTCFQFREKGMGTLEGQQKLELAQQLQQICAKYNVLYIINDDVDLAVAVNADGVHVGQEDMCLEEVRHLVGHKVVGISIHSVEELHKTDVVYADCVGVGPMYATSSKPDAQEPCGPNRISELQAEGLTLPCVGIGGITLDNAVPIIQGGACGIAIISAIAHADNPYEAAQQFKHLVDSAQP
ncbi:hydroxyethylthiazole kinase [Veillonella sp.]|uniref:hydroxyethylthiazole kinase n=1 Tax=Veillonella sp. TaxID=1926307 RepID=UPI00351F8BA1